MQEIVRALKLADKLNPGRIHMSVTVTHVAEDETWEAQIISGSTAYKGAGSTVHLAIAAMERDMRQQRRGEKETLIAQIESLQRKVDELDEDD